jgi:hypothetical protein
VPLDLGDADKKALAFWVRDRYPHLFAPAPLRRLVDECLSHHAATGNRRGYVDWLAACRNWVTKDQHFADQRKEARPEPREELFENEPQRLRVVK